MKFIKKRSLIEVISFAILLALFFTVLSKYNIVFGKVESDYINQHLRLFDYLRQSYFQTGQLLPQMITNYGGIQGAQSLIYYGYLNPIVFLSYFLPHVSTVNYLFFMAYVLILASFITMHLFLRSFNENKNLTLMFSAIYAFSMPLLFHLGMHLMFIYFFPVMPLSLYAIKILIDKKVMWLAVLCTALIFYFNFYFALAIGFVQLVFFIAYYFFYDGKREHPFKSLIWRYVLIYLIGLLIGFLPFFPQAIAIMAGSRTQMPISKPFIDFAFIDNLLTSPYSSALLLIPVFSFIYALFNYKDRFSLFIISALLLSLIITPINKIMNYNMYYHAKVAIYYIPLIYLVFVRQLTNYQAYFKVIISLIISIICTILIVYTNASELSSEMIVIFMIIQTIIILLIPFIKKQIPLTILFTLLVLGFNYSNGANVITKDMAENVILLNQFKEASPKKDYQYGFYRVNYKASNLVKNIDEMDAKIYVSVPETNWWDFNADLLLIPRTSLNRKVLTSMYDNPLFANIFGTIKSTSKEKVAENFTAENTENIRPMIYGVSNNEVYNYDDLLKIPQAKRVYALNQGVFTNDSKRTFNFSELKKTTIFEDNKPFTFDKNKTLTIDIPQEYQNGGFYEINLKASDKVLSKTKLSINGKLYAQFSNASLFLDKDISDNLFYYSAKNTSKLVFSTSPKNLHYTNLSIKYISNQDVNEHLFPYVKTTNNQLAPNQYLSFNINMPSDGYLATAIPYDDGFIINVNGKVVPNDKIDGYFLGTKLKAGHYDIKIEYQMPGFKIGAITTIIGGLILGLLMVSEIKWLNRPFFRFVIVGVFNTVNYFILYTILLNYLAYLPSHIISFLLSAFVSYFLTSMYTFQTKPSWKTLVAFPLTFLPNLIFSTVGTSLLIELHILSESIASLVVMLLIIPITFIINKVIFIRKKQDNQEVSDEAN